jgi:hypothetical protein
MHIKGLISFFIFLFLITNSSAQVEVKGRVYDLETGRDVPYAYVINFRTQNGVFCDNRGRFHINVRQSDTLIVSVAGYDMRKYTMKDSIPKSEYKVELGLMMKPLQLRTFTVKGPKTYDQIVRELEKIERMKAKSTSFPDAIQSPITYLYSQFSKTEKAKRKIAELQAEDARIELLMDLFSRYLVANIIEIDEKDIEDFIRYAGLTQSALSFETEYELVVHIKQEFENYRKWRRMDE